MGSKITFDEIAGPAPAQATAQAPAGPRPITLDEVVDPQRNIFLTGSVFGQKEPQDAPGGFGSNFGAALKSALIRDPATARREIARSLFPNDPAGEQRVGFFNGRPVVVNDDGQVEYVSGGGTNFAADMAASLPEMVAGGIGSVAASPVLGGSAGVAGARGLKNAAVALAYDEPQTVGANLLDVGVNAGLDAVGGMAAKGLLGAVNRGRTISFSPRDLAAAQARRDGIEQSTGVEVDLALASGDRRLLALRNLLAQSPTPVSNAIQTADEAASRQFETATRQIIDRIAAGRPAGELGQAGINAAEDAIKAARRDASTKVRPLYDAAYAAAPVVDDPVINGYLRLPYFRQAMNAGRRIAELERRGRPDVTTTTQRTVQDAAGFPKTVTSTETKQAYSLQDFDYLKQGLDDVIQKLDMAGKRKEAGALRARKNEFVAELDNRSGDLYKQARAAYAAEAKAAIEPLEKGWVGTLAKIKNPKAATAAARILRDENATVEDIQLVRMALSKQNPEAFDGLVRQYVVGAWNRAKRVTQGGGEVNAPGKLLQQVWGDETARAKMTAALGTQGARAFAELMDAAEVLARAPIRGSNTAPNQAIQQVLEGPSGWWLKTLLSPRQTAIDTAVQRAVERNSAKLWQALQDPAKVRQLRIAVRVSDPAQRASYVSAVLLGETAKVAGRPGKDNEPPQSARQ